MPNNNDVSLIIQRVAKKYLDWEKARSEVRVALRGVGAFELRDRIETAENHLWAISDEAYFYSGLAFRVTRDSVPNRPVTERQSSGRRESVALRCGTGCLFRPGSSQQLQPSSSRNRCRA